MTLNRGRFDLASGRHSAFMEVRKPLSEKAMSTHQTLRVQVTDTNQRPRGVMTIEADFDQDRKSTRLNSSHLKLSRMPSSA